MEVSPNKLQDAQSGVFLKPLLSKKHLPSYIILLSE